MCRYFTEMWQRLKDEEFDVFLTMILHMWVCVCAAPSHIFTGATDDTNPNFWLITVTKQYALPSVCCLLKSITSADLGRFSASVILRYHIHSQHHSKPPVPANPVPSPGPRSYRKQEPTFILKPQVSGYDVLLVLHLSSKKTQVRNMGISSTVTCLLKQ